MFGTFAIKETKRRNRQRISVVWYDIGYVRVYIYIDINTFFNWLNLHFLNIYSTPQWFFSRKKGHTSRNPSSSRATPLSKNKSTSYHSKTSILHPTFQLFYARLFNIKPTSNQHTQPTYWTQLQSHSPPIQTNPKIGTSTGGGTFGGSGARSNVFGLMGKKTHGEIMTFFVGGGSVFIWATKKTMAGYFPWNTACLIGIHI